MTKQLAVFGGMLAILTIGSGPAAAFEETTVAAPKAAAPAAQAQKQPSEGPAFDLQLPDSGDVNGESLKLQGSGSLKAMPKMDFGLELLYSSKESDDPVAHAGSTDLETGDDLKVMGTVKRRF